MSSTNPVMRGGDGYDDFPTPQWCVHRLLERVWLPRGRWLEPCAGAGNIIRATAGYGREWTAVEIQEKYAKQLSTLARYYSIGDFFEVSAARGDLVAPPFDVAITNPSYLRAFEVLVECRKLASYVVLLLRLGWLEGGASASTGAKAAFLDIDFPDVYLLPNRPSFTGGGTDSATYAWMVWTPERRRTGLVTRLALTSKAARNASEA